MTGARQDMTPDLPRLAFALLCVLGTLAIATGAFLEIARARRGDSLLAPWHLRLRLMSALVWVIVLLSLAGAVTLLWPTPNASINQKLQFLSVINGVALLLLLALALLGGDFWILWRTRRRVERAQAVRFARELHSLAETETERARAAQSVQNNGAQRNGKAPRGPSNSFHE